ncbi:hypothetical protein Ac2012v2_002013 [Leucoagaricus gongylophorus]
MATSERTPLLNSTASESPTPPINERLVSFFTAEGGPSWSDSFRSFFFGSYLNTLLVFVPLSYVSHILNWDAALRFSFSFLAIIPLAQLLGECTEQMSIPLGQTLAGLLNASFGNAVEIIVGVAALLQDEIRIVQTSMLGSILSNILLVLGCSFVAGGLLMTLACITLVIPAAYHLSLGGGDNDKNVLGLEFISRGTSIFLLVVYAIYLIFQLRTHAFLYDPTVIHPDDYRRAPDTLLSPEALERQAIREAALNEPKDEPKMNLPSATVGLLVVTAVTAFCAEFLVASIEETAVRYHIPKNFIGLILLPIVGNAAEHVTAVWMAMKNKMEITISVCVGSSIQIAAFVVPLLVIVGWM